MGAHQDLALGLRDIDRLGAVLLPVLHPLREELAEPIRSAEGGAGPLRVADRDVRVAELQHAVDVIAAERLERLADDLLVRPSHTSGSMPIIRPPA